MNTRILVFSDTHGRTADMLEIIRLRPPHAVFFLGDYLRDADEIAARFPEVALYAVRGNGDYASSEPAVRLVEIDGFRFFLAHGHTFGVKGGIDAFRREAESAGADVALFGHTHEPYYERVGDLQILNPGSLSLPRRGGGSFAFLEIVDGKTVVCNITER